MGADMLARGDGGKMELTTEGEVVLEATRRIEVELERLHAVGDGACATATPGWCSSGVVSTGKYFAPGAGGARSSRSSRRSRSSSTVGNRDQTIAALETRPVQLAIMGRPPRFPVNHLRADRPAPACADRAARPFARAASQRSIAEDC